jgi:hypothetical protein
LKGFDSRTGQASAASGCIERHSRSMR